MCVSNFPPVHEICPNYGVVMIQPQKVTIPDLGSVTIVTNFIYSPPSPPVSTVFSGLSFSFLCHTSPYQQTFIVKSLSLSLFHPFPIYSPGAKRHPHLFTTIFYMSITNFLLTSFCLAHLKYIIYRMCNKSVNY